MCMCRFKLTIVTHFQWKPTYQQRIIIKYYNSLPYEWNEKDVDNFLTSYNLCRLKKKTHWTSLNSLCILASNVFFFAKMSIFYVIVVFLMKEKPLRQRKMHYKNSFVAYLLVQKYTFCWILTTCYLMSLII